MRNYCLLFVLLFMSLGAVAQKGEVTVVKDPLIDSIIARRIELSKKQTTPAVAAERPSTAVVDPLGYRVQILYGSDRREIFSEQARFRNLFPKYNSYITYKAPNYYLRVGDFRTRMEAQGFLNTLKPLFPTLFIFREKINAPDLDK